MKNTWYSYDKAMSFSLHNKYLLVEYMYFVFVLSGPEEFKNTSFDMNTILPGIFEDVVNSKDVEVLYDRSQSVSSNPARRMQSMVKSTPESTESYSAQKRKAK